MYIYRQSRDKRFIKIPGARIMYKKFSNLLNYIINVRTQHISYILNYYTRIKNIFKSDLIIICM